VLQALDLVADLADLTFTFVALSPLTDIAAEPLDLDQHVFVATIALVGRSFTAIALVGRPLAAAAAAIADLPAETLDLGTQCVDRRLELRGYAAATAVRRTFGRVFSGATLVSGRARRHRRRSAQLHDVLRAAARRRHANPERSPDRCFSAADAR
jgi:hypothetical protein